MKIVIEYDSSWRASFLDGSNNEPAPKRGRKFIASSTALKNKSNQKYRPISKDTAMGVLNRLIGERRKLYQARESEDYYFKDIEALLDDSHIHDDCNEFSESTFLRNVGGGLDTNSHTGLIDDSHPALHGSPLFNALLAIANASLDEVIDYILDPSKSPQFSTEGYADPLALADRLSEINALKSAPLEKNPRWEEAINVLSKAFPEVSYSLAAGGKFYPRAFYLSAMYLMLNTLSQVYDLSAALTKGGLIAGISKRNFTRPDYMRFFSTSTRKRYSFGAPYQFTSYEKDSGKGIEKHELTKASGLLTITLPVDKARAEQINTMIDNAGVATFKMGKKGLAYLLRVEY